MCFWMFLFRCCISFRWYNPIITRHDWAHFLERLSWCEWLCGKQITKGGDQRTIDTAVFMFCNVLKFKEEKKSFHFGDTFGARCRSAGALLSQTEVRWRTVSSLSWWSALLPFIPICDTWYTRKHWCVTVVCGNMNEHELPAIPFSAGNYSQ